MGCVVSIPQGLTSVVLTQQSMKLVATYNSVVFIPQSSQSICVVFKQQY